MRRSLLKALIFCALPTVALAQVSPWTIDETYNVSSGNLVLEIQAGPVTDGNDPVFGIVLLFNDGVQNQLVGISDTPPYFDGIVDVDAITSNGQGFSMGDICVGPNGNAMPIVDNFNVNTYQYNDTTSAWNTPTTVPGTTTPNFFTSDCVPNPNGFFATGYNGQTNTVDIFRSTDGGASFSTFALVTHPGGVVTPHPSENFCGMRDTATFDPQSGNLIINFQVQNGDIFFQPVDSTTGTPGTPQLITGTPPAPGCAPFVLRESDINTAVFDGQTFLGGIFSDGTQFHGFLDPIGDTPSTVPLSPQGDGGSFGFIGVSFDTWNHPDDQNPDAAQAAGGLFDENGYFYIPGTGIITDETDFPGAGLGGPKETCTREQLYREIEEAFFGPDQQTSLYTFYALENGGLQVAHRPVGDYIFGSGFSDFQTETNWHCDKPYDWP